MTLGFEMRRRNREKNEAYEKAHVVNDDEFNPNSVFAKELQKMRAARGAN
mgnify:FL=1